MVAAKDMGEVAAAAAAAVVADENEAVDDVFDAVANVDCANANVAGCAGNADADWRSGEAR